MAKHKTHNRITTSRENIYHIGIYDDKTDELLSEAFTLVKENDNCFKITIDGSANIDLTYSEFKGLYEALRDHFVADVPVVH